MSLYTFTHMDPNVGRSELHDSLELTGAEISCNLLPAGVPVPFVHSHKKNEEIYIVLEGAGKVYLNGEVFPLSAGDCFRVAPEVERCISAAADSSIRFLCVQVKAGSLEGFTMNDGVMSESKPEWL